MKYVSLKKYLLEKKIELLELINELQEKLLSDTFTERDSQTLEIANAELNCVVDIINICNMRNRF